MAIRLARFEALSEALAACDEEIASYDSGTSPRYASGVNGAKGRIEELRNAAKPREPAPAQSPSVVDADNARFRRRCEEIIEGMVEGATTEETKNALYVFALENLRPW